MKTTYLPIFLALGFLAVSSQTSYAATMIGKHNSKSQSKTKILYGIIPVTNTLQDTLNNIVLRRVETYDLGKKLSPTWICPKKATTSCSRTFKIERSTSYSKSWTSSTSSTISNNLSAEFEGIGSSLESSFSIGFTVGTEVKDSTQVSDSFTFTHAPGTSSYIHLDEKWIIYKGIYDWFDGGLFPKNKVNNPWSVKAHYDNIFSPVIKKVVPPKAVPEPLIILGTGTAVVFGAAFKRKLGIVKKK